MLCVMYVYNKYISSLQQILLHIECHSRPDRILSTFDNPASITVSVAGEIARKEVVMSCAGSGLSEELEG